MRIYIAGPMRGLPDHNFPAFAEAARFFRQSGFLVSSPVEIGQRFFGNNPSIPAHEYLRADIEALARCQAICLLPGWENSTGARCEVSIAVTLGLQFYSPGGTMIDPPRSVTIRGGYERPAGPVDTLDTLAAELCAWAKVTFPKATPSSIAAHLAREVIEISKDPTDPEEHADAFFLLVQLAETHDLTAAVRAKLEKNKARQWGEPDEFGVVEHVR